MNVGFVCVNYNNSNVTIDFILNVVSLNLGHNLSIVIVDNASNSDDVNRLERFVKNKDVVFIKSVKNIGYFGGLNLGLDQLNKLEFDYIVIGNNDLNFAQNFLTILEKKNFEKGVLVVCPNIIRPDGIHQNPHVECRFSPLQKFYRKLYFKNYVIALLLQLIYDLYKKLFKRVDRKKFMEEKRILMGYGACYILTKGFFDIFGKLDAPNFLMGEEGVLANQVYKVNGTILYCPDLVVKHLDHTSIGKLPSRKLYEFNRLAYHHFMKECIYVQ